MSYRLAVATLTISEGPTCQIWPFPLEKVSYEVTILLLSEVSLSLQANLPPQIQSLNGMEGTLY
jgi:hypothetical protein